MTDEADLCATVDTAIVAALREHEGSYVTRWVAVVEVIAEAGDRTVWTIHDDGSREWDRLGLLEYARQCEAAGIALESATYHGDEDDET